MLQYSARYALFTVNWGNFSNLAHPQQHTWLRPWILRVYSSLVCIIIWYFENHPFSLQNILRNYKSLLLLEVSLIAEIEMTWCDFFLSYGSPRLKIRYFEIVPKENL